MDHETAIQMKASERYVVGDLASHERDAFEEHFADCSRCIDDVWMATTFAANARAVFREQAQAQPAQAKPVPRKAFFKWLFVSPVPALAATAFAALIAYQNIVVIPGTKSPRSAVASVNLDGDTRAGLPKVAAGDALRVRMPFDHPSGGARVFVELMDTLGNSLSSGPVAAPAPNQPLDIYFPVRLAPGRYTVVVRSDKSGRAAEEIARSSFEVTAQETKSQ